MLIREARASDSDSLADLARALGQNLSSASFLEDIAKFSGGFYVAEDAGSIIGYLVMCAAAVPACVQGPSPVQLWRLFVAPEQHGKGVAAALMVKAQEHALANGHGVIWLGTGHDNARALAFYRKSGFQLAGVARLHHGHESHEDVILSRVSDEP